MLTRLRQVRRDERGMSMVYVGMGFMAFLSATTLAIDVGMFMTARTQAQTSADAGALAGAVALAFNDFNDRSSSGPAVQSALNSARPNQVISGTVSVTPADVTFPTDPSGYADRVKVDVYRTAERANPVPTLMGSLFGVQSADVVATATAEASPANSISCVKPFIIPDRWTERRDPPWTTSSTFDRYYTSGPNKGQLMSNPDVYIPRGQPGYNGYDSVADKGTELVIRAGTGNNLEPTMYYSWKMPGDDIGADFYRNNISHCNHYKMPLSDASMFLTQEPGDMSGPTMQGIDDLIAEDPNAHWDTGCNCVKGSAYGTSPRVTPLPLFNPDYYQDNKTNGRNADFELANVVGFFIEQRSGNQVYGRITPILGDFDKNLGPAPTGSFPVAIKLVQ